jgi:hypothetical protein
MMLRKEGHQMLRKMQRKREARCKERRQPDANEEGNLMQRKRATCRGTYWSCT